MLHKGFLGGHDHWGSGKNRFAWAITLILYAGVCFVIASMFFMIRDVDRADSMIHIWLPFMIAGVVLVFLNLLIRLNKEWHRR